MIKRNPKAQFDNYNYPKLNQKDTSYEPKNKMIDLNQTIELCSKNIWLENNNNKLNSIQLSEFSRSPNGSLFSELSNFYKNKIKYSAVFLKRILAIMISIFLQIHPRTFNKLRKLKKFKKTFLNLPSQRLQRIKKNHLIII